MKTKMKKVLARRAKALRKSSPRLNHRPKLNLEEPMKFISSSQGHVSVVFKDKNGAYFYASAKENSHINDDWDFWYKSAQLALEAFLGREVAESVILDKTKLAEHYCQVLYEKAQVGGFDGVKKILQVLATHVLVTIGRGNYIFDLTGPDHRFLTMTDEAYEKCKHILLS